jgi:hypothetical protein
LSENPYSPPVRQNVAARQELHDDTASQQVSGGILVGLTIAIAIIAYVSVSSGVPSLISPFPLLVVVPFFFEVPGFAVPIIPALAFAVCHISHWRRKPRARLAIGLTILLWIVTPLNLVSLVAGWSYGIQYQGFAHTLFVVIVNATFAVVVWTMWWLATKPMNHRMQIAFGFMLFAWLSSFAFPWMGEI